MNNCRSIFILIAFLFLHQNAFTQSSPRKWSKQEVNYQIPVDSKTREYSFQINSPTDLLIKPVVNAYWFFISDVDGDNCPFRPSCSAFFAEAVNETNVLQGTLMFFDRFTRDMNFFSRTDKYPRVPEGYIYDPPVLYSLNTEKIKFIPPSSVVRE